MLLRAKGQFVVIADDLTAISLPFLVLWTLSLVILRLCRPRPPWSELVWQPGFLACSTALITFYALLWTDPVLGSDLPPAIIPCSMVSALIALAASRHWSTGRPSHLGLTVRGGAWVSPGLDCFRSTSCLGFGEFEEPSCRTTHY